MATSTSTAATAAEPFPPLRTERLTLRPLRADDAAELHRLVNDWQIARNLARVPFPYPRGLADEWIASTQTDLETGAGIHLAITGVEDDTEILVGAVGLRSAEDGSEAELGYWIGRRFWGHGVATEAAGRLTRWALANLDIRRVVASVAADNAASIAVLRRIGFRETGTGTQESLALGHARPVVLFEITRDDLSATVAPPPATGSAADNAPGDAPVNAKPILLVAACALIDTDGRILLARRPEGKAMAGLWEFPGGKLDPGETPEAALIRELKEELDIDVSAACLAPFAFASHGYEKFHLLMPLFLCRRWQGAVSPREKQTLAWVRPGKLRDYPMPPADLPLIPLLRDFLGP